MELVEGYRSRWSIECMFKDKEKLYGKTTSNDSMLRDFYFAYTMMLFNLWIFCNLIMFFVYMKQEPKDPKIRISTFKDYIRGAVFKPPDDDTA